MINTITQIWKKANSITEYIIALWISGLIGLFLIGMIGLLYGLVTGQADISNMTFGIFDTLG